MEPRVQRSKFFNPFHEARKVVPHWPMYKGFFRSMPMHRWKLPHVEQVLEFAALRPSMFGLPHLPTCIVNTAHFLPSSRSVAAGVWVFGQERGCKSLVIPRSCNEEPFDKVDAKLVQNLFRLNPGLEHLYLSQSCQPMVPQLVPLLSRLRSLKTVTLEGWNDAVAVHKVLMACKQAEVMDGYSYDQVYPSWADELSIQAINTVVEMHPKLRAVEGSRNFLESWYTASKYSRCRHNIALIPATCMWSVCFGALSVAGMLLVCIYVYRLFAWALGKVPMIGQTAGVALGFFVGVIVFGFLVMDDHINRHHRGRHWMHVIKYAVLMQRRWYLLWRRRGPTQLVTVSPK
jgi:hypothetical protein